MGRRQKKPADAYKALKAALPPDCAVVELFTPADPLQGAICNLLSRLTPDWQPLDFGALDGLEQVALDRLSAADIVELRIGATGRWEGLPLLAEAIFQISGPLAQAAQEVDRQIVQLGINAPGCFDDNGRPKYNFSVQKHLMGARLAASGTFVYQMDPTAEELQHVANLVTSGKVPMQQSARIVMLDNRQWSPSELQLEIWNALENRSMTTDDLVATLSVSRPTLFKKPGGLPQLLEHGLIRNDRAHGGYYRPDAPPQESN